MRTFFTLTALLLFVMTTGCSGLYKSYPIVKANKNAGHYDRTEQQAVVAENSETLLAETAGATESQKNEPEALDAAEVPELFTDDRPEDRLTERRDNDDTIIVASRSEQVSEALESERVARNAYTFSVLPITAIFFFPMLFVGIIGTLICVDKFNSFEYVTEEGIRTKEKALRTLLITSLVLALLIFLLVLLILSI